ncbi:hypothetical protein CMI37_28285 [Candidatus Pacearchaeota archaeon]|nr:hypothetical protein [Candidatus Pacearchaeota archaeon]
MREPFYCKAASIEASGSGVTVVNKRVTLFGIIVHGKEITAINDVKSIVFKNGSSGDKLYEAAFQQCQPSDDGAGADANNLPSTQVDFGANGILFPDSLWFEFGDGPGSQEGVDNIVFFYT